MSETWVDQPTNEIPPPAQWGTMNLNQLLTIKNQLLDKVYLARGNKAYLVPLNRALAELEQIISVKMMDPRGGN